jgi:hypothetical protein
MTNEEIWTQVAEFNKFGVLIFYFQICETKWHVLMFIQVALIRAVDGHERGERLPMAPNNQEPLNFDSKIMLCTYVF